MGEEGADRKAIANVGKMRQGENWTTECSASDTAVQPRRVPDPSKSAGQADSRPSPRTRKVGEARGGRTGSAPCPAGRGRARGCAAPYLLVDDGTSHLADVRQAVVPGRVLQQQHRLAAQADLQMERDAPGRRGDGSQEGRGPRPRPRDQRGGRCRRHRGHGQQRAGRPQDRRGAHRSAGRAKGRGSRKVLLWRSRSFFLQERRRKIKTFRKSPRAGEGEGLRFGREQGGGKMAEAGRVRRRERGHRAREAPLPPRSNRRGALGGTGRRVSAAGRRAGAGQGA